MKSGSWLSKNVRPLTLIFLTFIFVVLSFFDGNVGGFAVSKEYIPVYQTLLMVVYGAYFAGRSIEKVKKSDNK
jgi:peptidoglycan/LPS O-acetylase OafA/YrhL